MISMLHTVRASYVLCFIRSVLHTFCALTSTLGNFGVSIWRQLSCVRAWYQDDQDASFVRRINEANIFDVEGFSLLVFKYVRCIKYKATVTRSEDHIGVRTY